MRAHRRRGAATDLVEEILGDLGWRRVDRVARGLRRSLRTAVFAAAAVAIGSIAFEAADRFASRGEATGLDEAIRRLGEAPASWQQAGWSEWMGGIEIESSKPLPAERADRWNDFIAAAPWAPV